MLPFPLLQDDRPQPVVPELQRSKAPPVLPTRMVVLALMACGTGLEAAWLITADGSGSLSFASQSDASAELRAMGQRWPDDPVICFLDSPGRTLARLVAAGVTGDVESFLRRWARGATSMLWLRHRSPERTLLIDLSDLERSSDAVRHHLDARLRAGAAASVIDAPLPPDPLIDWVGQTIAAVHADVAQLWNELQASCELVGAPAAPASEAESAALALGHCRRWIDERAALSNELSAAAGRCDAAVQALAQARAALADATGAASALTQERQRLEQALELERLRVEQALEEIGTLAALARQAETELLQRDLSHQEALRLAAEREALLQSELRGHQLAHAAATASVQATAAALDDARAAQRDGLAQLQRQQHDLAQLRQAHQSIAGVPSIELPRCRELVFLHARNEPPHRELVVALRGVDAPAGFLDETLARLVEHESRPGLALFDTGARHALRQWTPNGSEAGQSFMLLIPQDAAGADRLARLATDDWTFVLGLTQRLRNELAPPDHALHQHWHAVAGRLHLALCQLPPVWRFNAVDAVAETGDDGMPTVRMRFDGACFGRDLLGPVELCWRQGSTAKGGSASAGLTLEWQRPGSGAVPLLAWPVQADGQWGPALDIPVGAVVDADLKHRWWTGLPAGDRALLLALLDALPAAVALPTVCGAAPWLSQQAVGGFQHAVHRLLARHQLGLSLRRTVRRPHAPLSAG